MSELVTVEFLARLKSMFPLPGNACGTSAVLGNPWYIISVVVYASSNREEGIPYVWKEVLQDLKEAQAAEHKPAEAAHQEQLLLARRLREGLLKAGLLCGYSRAINGMVALHEVMPKDLCDQSTLRDQNTSMGEYVKAGKRLFRAMYHDTADRVQNLLDEVYPDMGWFSNTVGYGIIYGATDVLTQVEISYILVASLIAMDTPRQVGWHLANAQHGGASLEEVTAVRQMSIEVAEKAGIQWRHTIPEVNTA